MIYEDGLGVEKDYQQASDWYRASAMHGATRGEYNLAMMYFLGRGVSLDYGSAYVWFGRAAAAGDAEAARRLKTLSTIMTPRQKHAALAQGSGGQDASMSNEPLH